MHNGYSGILDAQCRNQINDQNPVQITVTKSHHRFSGTLTIWGSVRKRMGPKNNLCHNWHLINNSVAMARKSMGCEHWIILLTLEDVPAGWPERHSIITAGVHNIPGCFSYLGMEQLPWVQGYGPNIRKKHLSTEPYIYFAICFFPNTLLWCVKRAKGKKMKENDPNLFSWVYNLKLLTYFAGVEA